MQHELDYTQKKPAPPPAPPSRFDCAEAELEAVREENANLRGLIAEALEGMEHVESAPGSWLARAREALKK